MLRAGDTVFAREEDTSCLSSTKWSAWKTYICGKQTEQAVFMHLEI